MKAAEAGDAAAFDRAFFGHVGLVVRNAASALLGGLCGGRTGGGQVPDTVAQPLRGYLRRLGRGSTAFALVSDAAMATLGGRLKRREKLSGRLADALAWLYLGSAVAKRFWDEGQRAEDVPFLRWGCEQALFPAPEALGRVLDNLPRR